MILFVLSAYSLLCIFSFDQSGNFSFFSREFHVGRFCVLVLGSISACFLEEVVWVLNFVLNPRYFEASHAHIYFSHYLLTFFVIYISWFNYICEIPKQLDCRFETVWRFMFNMFCDPWNIGNRTESGIGSPKFGYEGPQKCFGDTTRGSTPDWSAQSCRRQYRRKASIVG